MSRFNRRTTTRVKDGRVQKKNRHALTPLYWSPPNSMPQIDRRRAGKGYRHLLRKKDIVDFASIVPHWDEIQKGLEAIVLSEGCDDYDGCYCYDEGIIEICAWPCEIGHDAESWYFSEHEELLQKLKVRHQESDTGIFLDFNEPQARAFQLLHVLMHEIGHHMDVMSTRSRMYIARGEGYAERYANEYTRLIWDRYIETFPLY